jgi:hypothetical protein
VFQIVALWKEQHRTKARLHQAIGRKGCRSGQGNVADFPSLLLIADAKFEIAYQNYFE